MLSQAEYDILDKALGSGRYKWPHPYNHFSADSINNPALTSLLKKGYMAQNGKDYIATATGKDVYCAAKMARTAEGKLKQLISMATEKGSLTKEEILKVARNI